MLKNCFIRLDFSNNLILDSPTSNWPAGNQFASTNGIAMTRFNKGNGGDYRLSTASKYKAKATDGKDFGADISLVESAVSGIE